MKKKNDVALLQIKNNVKQILVDADIVIQIDNKPKYIVFLHISCGLVGERQTPQAYWPLLWTSWCSLSFPDSCWVPAADYPQTLPRNLYVPKHIAPYETNRNLDLTQTGRGIDRSKQRMVLCEIKKENEPANSTQTTDNFIFVIKWSISIHLIKVNGSLGWLPAPLQLDSSLTCGHLLSTLKRQ